MSERRTVEINGSHGEGGGALLRTALVVSALTSQPLHVRQVRGAMRKPGLNSEDLTLIQALSECVQADVEGNETESQTLTFSPRSQPRPLRLQLDVQAHEKGQTPGSALIIAQSLLPVLARSGGYSTLKLLGETHNNGAISYDAFECSSLAGSRAQGIYAFPALAQAGFGFAGRGEVHLDVEPSVIEPLNWSKRGTRVKAGIRLVTSQIPDDQITIVRSGLTELKGIAELDAEFEEITLKGKNPGLSLTIWEQFENGAGSASVCLGRGVAINEVAPTAVANFLKWHDTDATVDAYLADQLLVSAAFANGRTFYTTPQVTRRLVTMAWVIKQFLPIKITIMGRENEAGTVTIER